MAEDKRNDADLQKQIDELKKRVDELHGMLRDLIVQLSAKRIYRA
jgi:hypothetical protein